MTTQAPTANARSTRAGTRRRWLFGAIAVAGLGLMVPTTAAAQSDGDSGYVTTTLPAGRSLDVSAVAPACVRDAPYVNYSIVPVGFAPTSTNALLRAFDRNGTLVEEFTTSALSGSFIYPGATVDSAGNATDWPGWAQAPDGSWIPDQSDAILRQGLRIEVTLDGVTGTATVAYPAATTPCNGPDSGNVCVPGQNGTAADPCDPCVDGQNGTTASGATDPACLLPRTGSSGTLAPITIGGISLLAGMAALSAARFRRQPAAPTAG